VGPISLTTETESTFFVTAGTDRSFTPSHQDMSIQEWQLVVGGAIIGFFLCFLMDVLFYKDTPRKEVGMSASAAASGQKRDPLEKIDGIGPKYEKMLFEAGIFTFAQLAETPEGRLQEIIQPKEWQKVEFAKWIAEAKEFAAK
jgi:hypothetical protein